MNALDRDKQSIGLLDPSILTNEKKLSSINISPLDITKDQLIQLYLLLYPMIVADFVARTDLSKWEEDIHNEIEDNFNQYNTSLNQHVHIGNMGATTSTPVSSMTIKSWSKHPEDSNYKEGEEYVTDNSEYSDSIEHRDPSKVASNVSNSKVLTIKEQYSSKYILIPFDIDSSSDEYGDNEFAGSK